MKIGDKVIYTKNDPSSGLYPNKIYTVDTIDNRGQHIRLVDQPDMYFVSYFELYNPLYLRLPVHIPSGYEVSDEITIERGDPYLKIQEGKVMISEKDCIELFNSAGHPIRIPLKTKALMYSDLKMGELFTYVADNNPDMVYIKSYHSNVSLSNGAIHTLEANHCVKRIRARYETL